MSSVIDHPRSYGFFQQPLAVDEYRYVWWGAATWHSSLILLFGYMVLAYINISVLQSKVMMPLLHMFPKRKERLVSMHRKGLKSTYGVDQDSQVAFERATAMMATLVTHGMSGLVMVPFCLGLAVPPFLPSAPVLARHGILCETGWEIQDLLVRLYQRKYGSKEEKRSNPLSLMLIILMHHWFSLTMGLPLNIYHADCLPYFQNSALLLGGAAFAVTAQYVGYALNLEVKAELALMKVITAVVFLVHFFVRVVMFPVLTLEMAKCALAKNNYGIVAGISLGFCSLGLFNVLMMKDATQKLIKFVVGRLPLSPPLPA